MKGKPRRKEDINTWEWTLPYLFISLGLSETEIQKRLEEELKKTSHDGQPEGFEGEEEEDDDNDQSPSVDENGKILFRRPKSSKLKGKTGSTSSSSNDKAKKKSFEETLLGDARAKANDLKRKAGSSSAPTPSSATSTATSVSKSTAAESTKKKKQKTAKTTSLLSFDDEE